MRKSYWCRWFSLFMVCILLFGCCNVYTSAKKKVSLSKNSITVYVGKTATIKLKNNTKKVKWTTSNKKIAVVTKQSKAKAVIKAKKSGFAKITAKIGNKKYVCKVSVKKKNSAKTKTTTIKGTTQAQKKPSSTTVQADAGDYSINKVHKGIATFYDLVSGGAANLDDFGKIYYTTAMYEGDYLNNMQGAYLEVTDKDGDKINVMVTDILPYAEGKSGNLDLTRAAFKKIEPEVTGRMDITWKIIPLPTTEPIYYKFKPTSSQWWAEVQVRNHRYPIKKLEYKNSEGKYIELERKSYNYFVAPSGMGEGPFTFRVTDIYNHVLVDTGIKLDTTEKNIPGKANFPY